MYSLPLFPLNTVLFPTMPLSLHIFEERYKFMIRRCISANQSFGVVLIESGSEVQGLGSQAIPYQIGCTATITHVQELTLGRMNIVAVGGQRFEIVSYGYDEPYLVAQVETLQQREEEGVTLRRAGNKLRIWLERYLNVVERAERVHFDRSQMPADDTELAYFAASISKIPLSEKQELLAENSIVALLARMNTILQKESLILDMMVNAPEHAEQLPFSLN